MASEWNKADVALGGTSDWNKAALVGDVEASLAEGSTTQTTLGKVEAKGYDTLFSNAEQSKNNPFSGYKVSTKTLGELFDFSNPSGAYGQWVKPRLPKSSYAAKKGYTATPMGKYQFVGTTLQEVARKMKLPATTVFDENTQDSMFLFLAKDTVAKAKTTEGKRRALRGIWEGFKHVNNATLNQIILEIGNGE